MNLPLLLTMARMICALVLFPPLLLLTPWQIVPGLQVLVFVLVLFVALTDFLDGFCARWYNQVTDLGRVLDPLADKLFVSSILILFLVLHKIAAVWVILFISREFIVMGVRELALMRGFSVPVSRGGKVKTALQMLLILYLVAAPAESAWAKILLASALLASLLSAALYVRSFCQVSAIKTKRERS